MSYTSFEAFFDQEYAGLVDQLTLICGTRTIAEDAVQEAMVRCWIRWRRISRYDAPQAWVRLVAVRISARSSWRDRRLASRTATKISVVSSSETMCDEATDMKRCLELLSVEHREAIVLRYFVDMSVDDIASHLKLNPGTVKSRLYRARAALAVAQAHQTQRSVNNES